MGSYRHRLTLFRTPLNVWQRQQRLATNAKATSKVASPRLSHTPLELEYHTIYSTAANTPATLSSHYPPLVHLPLATTHPWAVTQMPGKNFSDAMESAVNVVEKATGIDIDKDGDIGVR